MLTGRCETYEVPGNHEGIFREQNVKILAEQLKAFLDNAKQTERSTCKVIVDDVKTHLEINGAVK